MLKISNLVKSYGKKVAVDGLNLTVERGDIFGFIGHNGAGKTTTIKCVSGILDFEGEIEIDGHSVKREPMACKQMSAYIPDNPDIYEHLTGIKYLNFVSDIYGIPSDVREANILNYADAFELKPSLGDVISSYSHGMKQKLALISAFIHSPKLLVLDEPFVGLDPKAAHTLKQLMAKLCEEGGAIFFSTHVLEVAQKLCNKVAIIKDGKVVKMGLTDTVCQDSSLEKIFLELYNE